MKNKKIEQGSTWACGYEATNSNQQYTSTSFIGDYSKLTKPVIKSMKHFNFYSENEIFPKKRVFRFAQTSNKGFSIELVK